MTDAAERVLADVREIAPSIAARSAEIEAAGRIPIDLVETLRSIGIFRMFVPESHGGLELPAPLSLEVLAELAIPDGAVGWATMIGSGSAIFAPMLPRETYDLMYADGPDVIIAGSSQPVGTAEEVDGGYRVTGRWPFASGCQHADWIFGIAVVTRGGEPVPGPVEGMPLMRMFLLPADRWQIEDTWRVAGLKGTGSHHVSLRDAVVPATHMLDLLNGPPCLPGPLYHAALQLVPAMHSAFAVGLAEGALADLVALASTGRRQLRAATSMRDSPIFQAELGRAEADFRAAQAYFRMHAASHWRHALAGTLKTEALMIEGTQNSIWVTAAALRVAEACFALGGGSALYDTSPLQRRLRDIHAAAQHSVVQQRNYQAAGAARLARARTEAPA